MDTDRWLMTIVEGLASADSRRRDRAADEVTDVLGSLTDAQVDLVSHLLVEARLRETDPSAAEAELNALTALAVVHPVPPRAIDALRSLPPVKDDPSQQEHLDELLRTGDNMTTDVRLNRTQMTAIRNVLSASDMLPFEVVGPRDYVRRVAELFEDLCDQ